MSSSNVKKKLGCRLHTIHVPHVISLFAIFEYTLILPSWVWKILHAELIIESSILNANVIVNLHPVQVMDESALRLWACHNLPIWASAIYQLPKVLPRDLLAPSLLPWYPPWRGCVVLCFFLSPNVFLGIRAVSDSASALQSQLP